MSSAKVDFTSRASRVTAKSVLITYEESKKPEAPNNFESMYQASAAPRKDLSNVFTIDVMPNFVPILCQVFFQVNCYISKLESAKHAKISAATLACYFMAIIYAHWLISDITYRPVPSIYASVYEQSTFRSEFLDFMLTLPVPSFIETIIKRFMPTSTEKRKNIAFVPTFAGYNFYQHFGRLIPLTFFTAIHDTVCESNPRDTPQAILQSLFTTSLYTVNNFTTNRNTFSPSVANYIAAGYPTTGTAAAPTGFSQHNSRVFQLFQSLFNPVLARDYTRRQHLASVSITPQTYRAGNHNPYDFVFAATNSNLGELRILFQSMVPLIKDNIPCSGNLASMYTTISGQSILKHGYSRYALPTWFASPASTNNAGRALLLSETDAFATAINFLDTPTPTYAVNHDPPHGACDTTPAHPVTLTHVGWPFNLLNNTARGTTENPVPDRDFEIFNDDMHTAPTVLVLDPIDVSETDAWLVSATGMTIESAEFDGTVIPVPNSNISLGVENTYFADSAVPYDNVFRAARFFCFNTRSEAIARNRVHPPRQARFAAASLLVDRTVINVPRPLLSTEDNLVAATLPGMTMVANATWFTYLQSFIGFRTCDVRSARQQDQTIPGVNLGRHLVFSPYTYTGAFDEVAVPTTDTRANRTLAASENRTYYLTNLRTIFGTDIPLIETRHAYVCLPVF